MSDTGAADFAEECARQARRVREGERAAEDEAWHEASDTSGGTA